MTSKTLIAVLGVVLVGWSHHAGAFEWALLQKPYGPQHVA